MWGTKAHTEKERFGRIGLFQVLDRVLGNVAIAVIFVMFREYSPVHRLHRIGCVDEFLWRKGRCSRGTPSLNFVGTLLRFERSIMIDLADGERRVAMLLQILGQHHLML